MVTFCLIPNGYAQNSLQEKRAMVTMRTIGHEVLSACGDSTSRIFPIIKQEENDSYISYLISFESQFEFDPDQLGVVIIPIMEESNLTSHYLVETQQCNSKDVIHSFEIGKKTQDQSMPCRGRTMPNDCYNLVITLFKNDISLTSLLAQNNTGPKISEHNHPKGSTKTDQAQIPSLLYLLPLLFLIGVLGFFVKKKQPETSENPYRQSIGKSSFNTRDRKLVFNSNETELSQKETDLLVLLNSSVNETIPRDVLLNKVWGDEGDYVGRTLDVFISKLRKKLDPDNSIKIENVRGVGYKLIVTE